MDSTVKRQPKKWEEVFADHKSDKRLIIQTIQRTPTTQQQKTPNHSVQKWAKDSNRMFFHRNTQMAEST